jgi:hypothetical protein
MPGVNEPLIGEHDGFFIPHITQVGEEAEKNERQNDGETADAGEDDDEFIHFVDSLSVKKPIRKFGSAFTLLPVRAGSG